MHLPFFYSDNLKRNPNEATLILKSKLDSIRTSHEQNRSYTGKQSSQIQIELHACSLSICLSLSSSILYTRYDFLIQFQLREGFNHLSLRYLINDNVN